MAILHAKFAVRHAGIAILHAEKAILHAKITIRHAEMSFRHVPGKERGVPETDYGVPGTDYGVPGTDISVPEKDYRVRWGYKPDTWVTYRAEIRQGGYNRGMEVHHALEGDDCRGLLDFGVFRELRDINFDGRGDCGGGFVNPETY